MPRWLHRTTKRVLNSVPLAELPEPRSSYIEEPDLTAVDGVPVKYWTISGDVVSEMTRAEKDAVDAAEEQARLDAARAIAKADLDNDLLWQAVAKLIADADGRLTEQQVRDSLKAEVDSRTGSRTTT